MLEKQPKGQSSMENQEKLAKIGYTKQRQKATQYALETTMRKQKQLTYLYFCFDRNSIHIT